MIDVTYLGGTTAPTDDVDRGTLLSVIDLNIHLQTKQTGHKISTSVPFNFKLHSDLIYALT